MIFNHVNTRQVHKTGFLDLTNNKKNLNVFLEYINSETDNTDTLTPLNN